MYLDTTGRGQKSCQGDSWVRGLGPGRFYPKRTLPSSTCLVSFRGSLREKSEDRISGKEMGKGVGLPGLRRGRRVVDTLRDKIRCRRQ